MNLLIENAPDFIEVGGIKLKIKSDFTLWVRFIIALEKQDIEQINLILNEIFGEIPLNIDEAEFLNSISEWLWQKDETESKTMHSTKKAFDFGMDGSIIFCELWEHFPHLMKNNITFHQGIELVRLLMSNENTVLHHRAFARCGDFSKMDKEQRKYWLKERSKYSPKISQKDIDNVMSECFI